MPEISIIMLTYNREKFVERAIKSILAQTFSDFEFILVDNGSTDMSGIICDKFAEEDNRIKVIHKEKGNIGSGRNVGLKNASGNYVAFIDDDDYALPEMFDILHKNIMKYKADISLCGSQKEINGALETNLVFEDIIELNREDAIVELLKRKIYNIGTPTKLFSKELFEGLWFSETSNFDDIGIVYKLFEKASKTIACGKPLYVVNRHDGNNSAFTTSHQWTDEILKEYILAYDERTEYLTAKVPNIQDYIIYTKWSYMISMCNKIKKYKLKNCETSYEYMYKCLKKDSENIMNSPYITENEKEIMNTLIL